MLRIGVKSKCFTGTQDCCGCASNLKEQLTHDTNMKSSIISWAVLIMLLFLLSLWLFAKDTHVMR